MLRLHRPERRTDREFGGSERTEPDVSSECLARRECEIHRRQLGPADGSVVPASLFLAERNLDSLSGQARIDQSRRSRGTSGAGAGGGIPGGTFPA